MDDSSRLDLSVGEEFFRGRETNNTSGSRSLWTREEDSTSSDRSTAKVADERLLGIRRVTISSEDIWLCKEYKGFVCIIWLMVVP